MKTVPGAHQHFNSGRGASGVVQLMAGKRGKIRSRGVLKAEGRNRFQKE